MLLHLPLNFYISFGDTTTWKDFIIINEGEWI